MAFSLATATLLLGGSAYGQALDPAGTQQSQVGGDYRMLGGQSLQLKKTANSSSALPISPSAQPVDPIPLPQSAPVMPITPIPNNSKPPVVQPVFSRSSDNFRLDDPKKDDPKKEDPKKDDPKDVPPLNETGTLYRVEINLPAFDKLFILESEAALERRIKQEYAELEKKTTNQQLGNFDFPQPKDAMTKVAFAGRSYSKSQILSEPNYVLYNKLLFSEKNSERYGWDLGFIQPVISVGYFVKDFVFLPYHAASRPFCQEITPACLPGDQVPYRLYREGLTITGVLAETGIAVALAFMIP